MSVCRTGVYCILNTVNGKRYVGSTGRSFADRWSSHRTTLRYGTHRNEYLQRAWAKHGEAAFEFHILLRCPPEECATREQDFMDTFRATDKRYGYNICPTAGDNSGKKLAPETIAKIRAIHLGRKNSAETIARMSKAQRGHSVSAAQRAKLAECARNRTPETRAKLRAARLGKKQSAAAIAKTTAANLGSRRSEAARANMVAAQQRLARERAAKYPRPLCAVAGCVRHRAWGRRGWCAMHYLRWRRHGNPLTRKLIRGDHV